jgi:hypothetical protein
MMPMLRAIIDEDFNNKILRGIRRRNPVADVVRVQDEGLSGADDPTVLEWAAQAGRLVFSHDVDTMTRHAYDRVREGKPMPGVFEVPPDMPIGAAIEELLLVLECSLEGEWEGQVRYLPLR